jgi:hypothetical protein
MYKGLIIVCALLMSTLLTAQTHDSIERTMPVEDLGATVADLDSASIARQQRMDLLDSIFDYICACELHHKDIVFRQVIWETGWLRGEKMMSINNLFGFRVRNYLTFNSWQESIDYYRNWQERHYTNPQEDYYKFLVRIKFSNHRYPGHLRKLTIEKQCEADDEKILTADN